MELKGTENLEIYVEIAVIKSVCRGVAREPCTLFVTNKGKKIGDCIYKGDM